MILRHNYFFLDTFHLDILYITYFDVKGILLMKSSEVNNYQNIQREKIFLKSLKISYSWN
jgi:hypothetical protein